MKKCFHVLDAARGVRLRTKLMKRQRADRSCQWGASTAYPPRKHLPSMSDGMLLSIVAVGGPSGMFDTGARLPRVDMRS